MSTFLAHIGVGYFFCFSIHISIYKNFSTREKQYKGGKYMLNRNLKISGATLLSQEEAENLLTEEERNYRYWW
jgi:hypothetical protein